MCGPCIAAIAGVTSVVIFMIHGENGIQCMWHTVYAMLLLNHNVYAMFPSNCEIRPEILLTEKCDFSNLAFILK